MNRALRELAVKEKSAMNRKGRGVEDELRNGVWPFPDRVHLIIDNEKKPEKSCQEAMEFLKEKGVKFDITEDGADPQARRTKPLPWLVSTNGAWYGVEEIHTYVEIFCRGPLKWY